MGALAVSTWPVTRLTVHIFGIRPLIRSRFATYADSLCACNNVAGNFSYICAFGFAEVIDLTVLVLARAIHCPCLAMRHDVLDGDFRDFAVNVAL